VLWTNSRRDRTHDMLQLHDLRKHFTTVICREDYDPKEQDVRKDIRKVKGDLLVDDSPEEIAYQKTIGRKGFLVSPFRKGKPADTKELLELYKLIRRGG